MARPFQGYGKAVLLRVWSLERQPHRGTWRKRAHLGPTPHLRNQKLWVSGTANCAVKNPPAILTLAPFETHRCEGQTLEKEPLP